MPTIRQIVFGLVFATPHHVALPAEDRDSYSGLTKSCERYPTISIGCPFMLFMMPSVQ